VIDFLRQAAQDNKTGLASSKRVALLISVSAMSLSIVILSVAVYYGHDTAIAIGSLAVPLSGLAGYGYVRGKVAEDKRDAQQ